jgi:imidazoleglycerol-phosphate dehydratase
MSKARIARFDRQTTETQIKGALAVDGRGRYEVRTGIRFFDHMLELFTRHGGFDLKLAATGDLDVDQHHTVEDVGIVLGEAVLKALGDRKGINRAGYFVMPMDETLAVAAVDLSGRPHAVVDLNVRVRMVGDLQTELVHDFFDGFASGARANVHVKVLYGRSSHHHIEAVFKAFARALRVACAKDARLARMLPSTKGLL